LLANIALSALDDHFDRQWQQEMGTKQQRANRRRNQRKKSYVKRCWRVSGAIANGS
jgi:hypothetical protein